MPDLFTTLLRRGRARHDAADVSLMAPVDFVIDAPLTLREAEAEVRRMVAHLASGGSLSAETAEALDSRIESWRVQWVEQLNVQRTRTTDGARRLVGRAEAEVARQELRTLRAEAHLTEAEGYYSMTTARLGMPIAPVAPPTPAPIQSDTDTDTDTTNEEDLA